MQKINRPVFDMLRSAAVIMVFMIHFLAYRNIAVPQAVFNVFTHCSYGVSFFFAISGYLIMQSIENSKSIKEYFVKRVSRIIPSYYVVLIFGMIVWDVLLGQMPKDTLLGVGWLRYFLFLNTIIPSNDYFYWNDLWGLWTMSCFMLFYLLTPIVRKYINSYRQSIVLTAAVIVIAYGIKYVIFKLMTAVGIPDAQVFAGDSAFFNMISFAFGVAAWYAVKEGKAEKYLSVVIVLLTIMLLIREDSYNRIIWSLIAVAFMLAMRNFEYSDKTAWIGKVLDKFSKYSFTVYLVHMPVLDMLELLSSNVIYLGFVPFTILAVLTTAIISILLNRLVERPFYAMLRRLG